MSEIIAKYANLFRCPDDGADARYEGDRLSCAQCRRQFPILSPHLVEMMPSNMKRLTPRNGIEQAYFDGYRKMFEEKFEQRPAALPWGHISAIPPKKRWYVQKQQRLIAAVLPQQLGVYCDVSTGNGFYSLSLTARAEAMILCDISVDSVNYLNNTVKKMGAKNIIVIRCDYNAHPLKPRSAATVLCTDTFDYGPENDQRLLATILQMPKEGGTALVNFKNRRHRLPFKKPIMMEYGKKDILRLLRQCEAKDYRFVEYHQELEANPGRESFLTRFMKSIIPPTRFYLLLKQ